MEELLAIDYQRSDCLYHLGFAQLKLGQHYDAKQKLDLLLRLDPHNLNAIALRSLVLDRTAQDGMYGVITLGLSLALATMGGVLYYLHYKRT